MQGIQMGMEGPMMSGTWVNPATGHKFTVRDCYFENDQFMVQTTEGQILDYNTIQNYIQCQDNSGHAIEPTPDVIAPQATTIPTEIADMLVPEDAEVSKGLGNLNDRHFGPGANHQVQPIQSDPIDEDMRMVDRVLKRHEIPAIDASITWNVPQKQIETLVDILGIDPEVIAKYYINKIDMEAVSILVQKTLIKYINNIIGAMEGVQAEPATELIVNEPPKPTSKSKTIKKKK